MISLLEITAYKITPLEGKNIDGPLKNAQPGFNCILFPFMEHREEIVHLSAHLSVCASLPQECQPVLENSRAVFSIETIDFNGFPNN